MPNFFLVFFCVFFFVGGGDNQYPYVLKSATYFCIYTHLVKSTGDLQVTWKIKKKQAPVSYKTITTHNKSHIHVNKSVHIQRERRYIFNK